MDAGELKACRAELGLTQVALASRLGVSVSAVTHWEQGRRSVPGPVVRLLAIWREQQLAETPRA